ncbi:MAG: hypothetical protein KJN73_03610, partial [Acidimicrobiia bacterium]|nr:hypothetical protein [Acidimicrobiia bacterium]
MTTRAELQGKSLEDLRTIASSVGVETDGLQKAKLIAAILGSDKFELSEEPAEVELPSAEKVSESNGGRKSGSDRSRSGSNRDGGSGRSGGSNRDGNRDGGPRKRNRKRGGRDREEPIDESELETREGLLDILPEGYGFLRVGGYLPGEQDVYVPANQIRKFGLRKGDLIEGPVRPPRSQEKFAALVRAVKNNGMDPEEARKRPKFGSLT